MGSRCSNPGWPGGAVPAFPPPLPGVEESVNIGVLDVLKIPEHLEAGEYVLGWRYDCEGTAQVWSNCADVTIAAAGLLQHSWFVGGATCCLVLPIRYATNERLKETTAATSAWEISVHAQV